MKKKGTTKEKEERQKSEERKKDKQKSEERKADARIRAQLDRLDERRTKELGMKESERSELGKRLVSSEFMGQLKTATNVRIKKETLRGRREFE